jgi:DNA-binding transcriptional LysR family regulator
VTFCLFQEQPQVLQEKLLGGIFHLGIGSTPHKISGLEYEFLYEEHHSLYCGLGHDLFAASEAAATIDSVRKYPIASRGYWREGQLRQMGFERIEAIVYHIEPQLSLIMSGGYLGFLPDHFAKIWEANGHIRKIAADTITYTCAFEIITRRRTRRTELVDTFLGDLRTSYRQAAASCD